MGSTPKRKAASAAAKTSGFHLFYPVLISCDLDRKTLGAELKTDAKKSDRFYDCRVQPVQPENKDRAVNLAVCEFAAGRKHAEEKLIEITATYYVGFSHQIDMTMEQEDAFLSELASTAAWPLFRDLFIHIGSQTGDELPLLPNIPHVTLIERGKVETTDA